MTTSRQHCAATRTDGRPCQAWALPTGRFCWAHAPEHAASQREARRRGGAHRANSARLHALVPPRLISVYDKLEQVLDEVIAGTLEPKYAVAAAAVARAMVSVLVAGETEQRIRDLEARARLSTKAS